MVLSLAHNNKGTATSFFLSMTFQIADGGEIRLGSRAVENF